MAWCTQAGMSRDLGWDVPALEKLYASKPGVLFVPHNFVCLTKVLSYIRLSEGIPCKTCVYPQARGQKSTEQTSMRTNWFKHIAI